MTFPLVRAEACSHHDTQRMITMQCTLVSCRYVTHDALLLLQITEYLVEWLESTTPWSDAKPDLLPPYTHNFRCPLFSPSDGIGSTLFDTIEANWNDYIVARDAATTNQRELVLSKSAGPPILLSHAGAQAAFQAYSKSLTHRGELTDVTDLSNKHQINFKSTYDRLDKTLQDADAALEAEFALTCTSSQQFAASSTALVSNIVSYLDVIAPICNPGRVLMGPKAVVTGPVAVVETPVVRRLSVPSRGPVSKENGPAGMQNKGNMRRLSGFSEADEATMFRGARAIAFKLSATARTKQPDDDQYNETIRDMLDANEFFDATSLACMCPVRTAL